MRRHVLAASVAIALCPALASGHALLLNPHPRSTEDGNKVGPCDSTPVANPLRSTFQVGSTIEVEWMETIEHPGRYRIAFSPDGDGGFEQNVLMTMVDNKPAAPQNWKVPVKLPDTPCENCALQLIQCMTPVGADPATAPCSNYYSCANIRLVAELPDAGPGAPDAGGASLDPDGGPSGADAGPIASDDGVGGPPGLGLCAQVPGAPGREAGSLVFAVLAIGFALHRRRARVFVRRRHR
jgi:hypothetical protein